MYVALPLSMPESKGFQVNRGRPARRENRGCRAIKGYKENREFKVSKVRRELPENVALKV